MNTAGRIYGWFLIKRWLRISHRQTYRIFFGV
jgi:hypothetical protein